MTWHIITLSGPEDTYRPQIAPNDRTLLVPMGIPDHPDRVQNTAAEVFAEYGIAPSTAAGDLLAAATAAYTGDLRVPRHDTFDNWTRDLVLHLGVCKPDGWDQGSRTLARLLAFLTGDRWHVQVRPVPRGYRPSPHSEPRRVRLLKTRIVSLFSGGLDSFVGAVDWIEAVGPLALVGHHSAGGGPTSTSQSRALKVLRNHYDEGLSPFFQFWVSPPKGTKRTSEITTRGRSFMFLGLGIAVADGLGAERLLVPENGFISLNVPLTASRLGSFSTRTTHPHLIQLLQELLSQLGIGVAIDLPYRFRTKGELIRNCANRAAVVAGLAATMSCAHPSAARFSALRDPNRHCGRCVPCLIRRAGITSVIPDPTLYAIPDLATPLTETARADLRAFRLALDRYGQNRPTLADLLMAGPLPGSDADLAAYLGVYERGLSEVRCFLDHYSSTES
jgi:7-cyano-7-deazaguanine synthase in queuosine biosynthesis